MKTVNDIPKPSLDDDLTHFGVKGMKWGVRRDQVALDKAAGRTLTKGRSRGKQIKKARASVKKSQKKLHNAEDARDAASKRASEATTPAQRKKTAADLKAAEKKFEQSMQDFENNPKRAVAAKITYGESAAVALASAMTLPVSVLAVTGAVVGATAARSAVIRKQQRESSSK